MTPHGLRLPGRARTPAARRPELIYLRIAALLAAWAFVCLHWVDWAALPFQAAIAAGVVWQALRRETLVRTLAAERAQSGDVAARLRVAEERYRTLVETLPLAMYVDGAAGAGVAWVSPQITEITSYAPEEWAADPQLFATVLHDDDRERVLEEKRAARETGTRLSHEYRLVRRDGAVVWIHDSAATVGESARGYILDVTTRREAELELAGQNERLRELDRLKDEFVALVSHELRTPLTSIRGYVELMTEDTTLSEEQARFLRTIDRNAQRLQRVVGDLLFVAQVEAGKVSLERGQVDLNSLVRDSLEAGRPAAVQKSIALRGELAEVPAVTGDRARLAQVLDNLISNAIKFTPSDGVVTVATTRRADSVELTVADTGMGIPAAELPRLFDRFFRTERATSSAIPGTGLGLAIAKAIVDGHGGTIAVESADGAGTTFRISLPL